MQMADPTREELNPKIQPQAVQEQIPATNADPDTVARHEEVMRQVVPEHIQKQMGPQGMMQAAQKSAAPPPIGQPQPVDMSKMIPIEGLPSQGKFYDTPLYGRALKVGELKKLDNMGDNASSVIDDIIRSACGGPAFEQIMVGDKLFIILWLRANTYPKSQYRVRFLCDGCDGAESEFHFSTNNVSIKPISSKDINGPLTLSNGDSITFKYITIADENRIKNFQKSVRSSKTVFDDDTLILASSITGVNGEQKSLMSLHSYLHSSPEIYAEVDSYLSDFDFGIDPVLNVTCSRCGGISPMGLSFRRDFIIPSYFSDDAS